MKRKPPKGYSSWIEFHDKFKDMPEFDKNKQTLHLRYQNPRRVIPIYSHQKFRWSTVERNCWREMQEYRMVKDPSIIAQHYIKNNSDNFHREYTDAACRLLDVLTIEE